MISEYALPYELLRPAKWGSSSAPTAAPVSFTPTNLYESASIQQYPSRNITRG
jgi:hypothetical protein